MKGVGWEASKSLDIQQAKKAGALVSEVTYDPECFAGIIMLNKTETCLHFSGLMLTHSNSMFPSLTFINTSLIYGNCIGTQM